MCGQWRRTARGRKQRTTPLTRQTVQVLRAWLAENPGEPSDPLFPASHSGRLSRDAVERLLAKHAAAAAHRCPTLNSKEVPRTSCATPAPCASCTLASTPR